MTAFRDKLYDAWSAAPEGSTAELRARQALARYDRNKDLAAIAAAPKTRKAAR